MADLKEGDRVIHHHKRGSYGHTWAVCAVDKVTDKFYKVGDDYFYKDTFRSRHKDDYSLDYIEPFTEEAYNKLMLGYYKNSILGKVDFSKLSDESTMVIIEILKKEGLFPYRTEF